MIGRAAVVSAIETYCRVQSDKDAEGWAALYAADVTYEDPVGIRLMRGKEAVVGSVWDDIVRRDVHICLTDDVIVRGNEALAIMACEFGPETARRRLSPVVDEFRFDDAGKIVAVRGFYNLPDT